MGSVEHSVVTATLKLAATMRYLFSFWHTWTERRRILRDVQSRRADKDEETRFLVKDQLASAIAAIERDNTRYAADVLQNLMSTYPVETRKSVYTVRVLLGLRRYDEAEEMMRNGLKAHPHDAHYWQWLLHTLHSRGNFAAAVEHAAHLRQKFPNLLEGYTIGAEALIALKRYDEAERLAHHAMTQFQDNVAPYITRARILMQRESWDEALNQWLLVKDRFYHLAGYLGAAQILVQKGDYESSKTLLGEARLRAPTEPVTVAELGRLAEKRGLLSEAIEHWQTLAQRFPMNLPSCLEAGHALERLGAHAEASTVFNEALDHFPDQIRVYTEFARLLLTRPDYGAAADQWSRTRAAFPNDEEAYLIGAYALEKAGRTEEAAAVRTEYQIRFKSA